MSDDNSILYVDAGDCLSGWACMTKNGEFLTFRGQEDGFKYELHRMCTLNRNCKFPLIFFTRSEAADVCRDWKSELKKMGVNKKNISENQTSPVSVSFVAFRGEDVKKLRIVSA